MKVHEKYLKQADELIKSGFGIFGLGNFNVDKKDIAVILFLLNNKKWKELSEYYSNLHEKVFGEPYKWN